MNHMPSLSLYIHIPFCRQRCSYCAFNTYAGLDELIPAYVQAVRAEIIQIGRSGGRPDIHTIYFGGGTPTMLTAAQVGEILEAVGGAFSVAERVEVTLEANPSTAGYTYFHALRTAGVTRLSLGAQSAQKSDLRLFHRDHSWEDVIAAVGAARAAGFDNISLDLIYGAPGQTLSGWQQTLRRALALMSQHISLYSLGVEPGTAMHGWIEQGRLEPPDPDRAADMYERASDALAAHGFQQYEISNWSQPGYACQHNLQYWRNRPYLGFGAGAHGFAGGMRYAVVSSPQAYVRRLVSQELPAEWQAERFPLSPAVDVESVEIVDRDQERAEAMMLGLRLTQEGVSRVDFARRFGQPMEAYYGKELAELAALALIEISSDRIRLTPKARLVANYVFRHFV